MKILVVEDQRSARRVLERILSELSYATTVEAESVEAAKAVLESTQVDLVLADIRLSGDATDRGGLELLAWMKETERTTPAVVVTASSELSEVREAMRLGAQDYVLKDELSSELLLPVVQGIFERQKLRGEVQRLRQRVDKSWGVGALVGSSPAMARVRRLVERIADAEAPVLIRGATGTGKELASRALHGASLRNEEPFIAVNCSALPGNLVESLLFGHERGAFTGADRRARGHFEVVGSGTILLDEIAEMPLELQAKLLRVLEDRRFRPLGAAAEQPLKGRVVAATHVDLEERIRAGRFREDLYFRLNVVTVDLPSLAERREDFPELMEAFLSDLPRRLTFTERAVAWLVDRPWPGNVRELRNALERLVLLAEADCIDVPELEEIVGASSRTTASTDVDRLARAILALPSGNESKLRVVERAVLTHALQVSNGNKSAAARLIGVDRKVLDRKWDRLGEAPEGE